MRQCKRATSTRPSKTQSLCLAIKTPQCVRSVSENQHLTTKDCLMRPHHCQSITASTNLTFLRFVAKFRVLKQKRLFVKAVTWPNSTQHFSQEVVLPSSQEMMLVSIPCQSNKTILVKSKLSTPVSKQQRNNT